MTLDEAIAYAEEVADVSFDRAVRFESAECGRRASEHHQLAEWLRELKQLREQTRWIPVSERTPEEDGQYNVTVKYKHEEGYEDIYAEHGDWYNGEWDMSYSGHCGEVEKILAWMPLPEPYKVQKSEDEE